jgi:hypothetical protein
MIIICKIQCLSVNARHQLQDCSISCSGLPNEYWRHYRATESVQSFIIQHILIYIGIVQGIIIIIEKFRKGQSCMLICIFKRHIDDLRILSSGSATGWSRWHAGQRWSRIWSPLPASDGWWCTCAVPSPVCLRILCGAISAMKAAGHVGFDEALPGVFVSYHSPLYAQQTQHPASSRLGPWRVVT